MHILVHSHSTSVFWDLYVQYSAACSLFEAGSQLKLSVFRQYRRESLGSTQPGHVAPALRPCCWPWVAAFHCQPSFRSPPGKVTSLGSVQPYKTATPSTQVVAGTARTSEGDKAIHCKTSASIAAESGRPAAQRGMP